MVTGTWRDVVLTIVHGGTLVTVTVGWWGVLSHAVVAVAGSIAGICFAFFSALSATVGYALIRCADSQD